MIKPPIFAPLPKLGVLGSRSGRIDIPSLIGMAIFLGAMFLMYRTLQDYSWAEILASMKAVPTFSLWMAAMFGLLNYVTLFFYEILAFQILGKAMPVRRLVWASFVANAFGHTLGFPSVTGAALRYRFYTPWGLKVWEVAQVTALTYIPATFGFLALTGFAFVMWPIPLPASVKIPGQSLQWLGLGMLASVLAYLGLTIRWRKPIRFKKLTLPAPRFSFTLLQIMAGVLKWLIGGVMIYILIEGWNVVSVARFVTIYCIAQTVAILTHAPGGLGVFDATLLLFLKASIPPPVLAGALLLYRVFYNLLPLLVSMPFYFLFEYQTRARRSAPLAEAAG
jgi:uncharacterized membrane protein YbhN (UPF0104 family)